MKLRVIPILFAMLVLLCECGPGVGSIGAILGKHNSTGQVTIRDVPDGMGAAEAGLRSGDQILSIDGRDARSMTPEQVHESLAGPVGSTVALTVERDGRILRLHVRRGPLRSGVAPGHRER